MDRRPSTHIRPDASRGSGSSSSRQPPSFPPKGSKSKFSLDVDFVNELPVVADLPKLIKSPYVSAPRAEIIKYNGESIEAIQGVPLLSDR